MSAAAVSPSPGFGGARGSARSVGESCNPRSTRSICWRSTTVKRLVATSASSRDLLMGRSPSPVMPPMATLWYGAMLISAGFITGRRTETVLQAAHASATTSARASARTGRAKLLMFDSPRDRTELQARSVASRPRKGQLSCRPAGQMVACDARAVKVAGTMLFILLLALAPAVAAAPEKDHTVAIASVDFRGGADADDAPGMRHALTAQLVDHGRRRVR